MPTENVPEDPTLPAQPPASGGRQRAPRATAALVLVAFLVAGFAAGVVVDRVHRRHVDMIYYLHRGPMMPGEPAPPPWGPPPQAMHFKLRPRAHAVVIDRFMRELDLTPAQSSALDTIMAQDFAAVRSLRDAMQPKVDSVVARTRQRIDSVLTPIQREHYHTMLRWHGFMDPNRDSIER
jgi:hypothetical protein